MTGPAKQYLVFPEAAVNKFPFVLLGNNITENLQILCYIESINSTKNIDQGRKSYEFFRFF